MQFATKPALATAMITAALDAGAPASWGPAMRLADLAAASLPGYRPAITSWMRQVGDAAASRQPPESPVEVIGRR